MLDHLAVPAAPFLFRQSAQEGGVNQNEFGVGEGAYLVFNTVVVDSRLPSHASIDHGEERGRYVDEGDAALEGARHKTAKIEDDPAPYIDHQTIAVGAIF